MNFPAPSDGDSIAIRSWGSPHFVGSEGESPIALGIFLVLSSPQLMEHEKFTTRIRKAL